MCRLYGFRANDPTKVECTLVHAQNALMHQSRVDLAGLSHPDGWGIGYYRDGDPVLERRETAAFRDAHFSLAAERVHATTVIAHVRLATVGGPSLENTHPFTFGRWLFAHNGTVEGFEALRDRIDGETAPAFLALRRGTTDSEAVFHWLLTRIQESALDPGDRCADPAALARVVGAGIHRLVRWSEGTGPEEPPRLNFLLTDGATLIATRWNRSLHWIERSGIRDCEICGIPHVRSAPGGPTYRAVVVASEPVSHEAWRDLPNHSLLTIDSELRTAVEQL